MVLRRILWDARAGVGRGDQTQVSCVHGQCPPSCLLTTSGGSERTSSNGVSRVFESTFMITTSSRALSRTLYVGVGWQSWSSELRIPGWVGEAVGRPPPLHPSTVPRSLCPHLGKTSVHSDEVGHGCAVERRAQQVSLSGIHPPAPPFRDSHTSPAVVQ